MARHRLRLSGRPDLRRANRFGHSEEDHDALTAAARREHFVGVAEAAFDVLPVVHHPDIARRRDCEIGLHLQASAYKPWISASSTPFTCAAWTPSEPRNSNLRRDVVPGIATPPRAWTLAEYQCCTTDSGAIRDGDLINLVVVESKRDPIVPFIAREWHLTQKLDAASIIETWNLTTHKIGPDVDFDRGYLLQDLLMSGFVERYGFIDGVRAATMSNPRTNLTGDPSCSFQMKPNP